jgi:SnoaL-like domain
MNAVERFLVASRARDVDAAVGELAPDVVMLNPATDDPVVGKQAVAAALRAVEKACDEFRHTHLFADTSSAEAPLYGLVFEAKIGAATLRGVDLIEIDRARPHHAVRGSGSTDGRSDGPRQPYGRIANFVDSEQR